MRMPIGDVLGGSESGETRERSIGLDQGGGGLPRKTSQRGSYTVKCPPSVGVGRVPHGPGGSVKKIEKNRMPVSKTHTSRKGGFKAPKPKRQGGFNGEPGTRADGGPGIEGREVLKSLEKKKQQFREATARIGGPCGGGPSQGKNHEVSWEKLEGKTLGGRGQRL